MALDPEDNPLYATSDRIHPLHWEALCRREPGDVVRAAGAAWHEGSYLLPMLGRELLVSPREGVVRFAEGGRAVGYQRGLVALAYLAGAMDAPCSGQWVAFRQLPGGHSFFRGPHAVAADRLARAFGARPRDLPVAAAALAGSEAEGGDAAAEVPALPRIPVKAVVWAGSAEFGSSAALLVDSRAQLHAPLDILWALSNVTIDDLVEEDRC